MRARQIARAGVVELEGQAIAYTLYRVARRRNVHLLVTDDAAVEVRAPWRYSDVEGQALLRDHAGWLLNTLCQARRNKGQRPVLANGSVLRLLDEELSLRVVTEAQLSLFASVSRGVAPAADAGAVRTAQGRVTRRGRCLFVHPYRIAPSTVRGLLEAWFRYEARLRLPIRLRGLAVRLGVRPARITVRAQKHLWGSCTEHGNISLNWRLVLLPTELADYVLVHELCHLRYLDHSQRFWAMVGSVVPDFAQMRERLRARQGQLAL